MPVPAHLLLDPGIPRSAYRAVDLSTGNPKLGNALRDAGRCQEYLKAFLRENGWQVAYGGYLEQRDLYRGFGHFNPKGQQPREYHLGVDFWAQGGTTVHAPWEGRVHSWANRDAPGDYGPVILLEHLLEEGAIFGLYGHLSLESLNGLHAGKSFRAGERIACLGSPKENGGYAPHLHFQLIRDLRGNQGDFPGVCAFSELPFFRKNCPDPMVFLGYF